jgi:hypothetical protein
LRDWDVKIYFGIKTGFNEAFLIDTATKEKLCDEDPKSIEIIRPILRGRDIGRYYYEFAGKWIINTNFDLDILKFYPAVFEWLKQFESKLKKRDDQGKNWWNLRACAYYGEFEKEKIVYSEIVREPQFYFDADGKFYVEATNFLIIGKNLKYLTSLLNSKFITFIFKRFYAGGGLGDQGYRYKKVFVERLPISIIDEVKQRPFIEIVDKILAITKSSDYLENSVKQAKVCDYEKQIDQMVYKLYNLTPEEIKIVEKSN